MKTTVLAGGKADVKQTDTGLEILVPPADRQAIDTIIALKLDKPAIEITPIATPGSEESAEAKKKAI